jgi:hypothetical protein
MKNQAMTAMVKGLIAQLTIKRDRDAAPMPAHLAQRRKVDLDQHRDDHQPDQHRHRQVHIRNLGGSDGLEERRKDIAEADTSHDAKGDPDRQVALECRHVFLLVTNWAGRAR